MKRFLVFFSILLLSSGVWADTVVVVGSGAASGGAACAVEQTYASGFNAYTKIQNYGTYGALKFTVTTGFNVTQIGVFLSRVGSSSGNILVSIYSDGGTDPGSSIVASATTLDSSTISDVTGTEYTFPLASTALGTGMSYYAVIDCTGVTGDGIRYWMDNTSSLDHGDQASNDGITFSDLNDMQGALKIYSGGCP